MSQDTLVPCGSPYRASCSRTRRSRPGSVRHRLSPDRPREHLREVLVNQQQCERQSREFPCAYGGLERGESPAIGGVDYKGVRPERAPVRSCEAWPPPETQFRVHPREVFEAQPQSEARSRRSLGCDAAQDSSASARYDNWESRSPASTSGSTWSLRPSHGSAEG